MKASEKPKVLNRIHDLLGIDYIQDIKHQGLSYVFLGSISKKGQRDKQVVVKMLGAELASSPSIRQRFDDEAKLYQELFHPNIVSTVRTDVVNFDEPIGTHRIIVMEYVSGRSLKDVIAEHAVIHQNIDEATALSIVCPVLDALEYLHTFKKNGQVSPVIHADINPNNILVAEDGTIKLIDFGLFRLASADKNEQVKTGTLTHMAPEQFERQPLSIHADLFSVSVVLGDLLIAGQINQGQEADEILDNIKNQRYPIFANSAVDERLKQLVFKGLSPNPEERFASASQFKQELLKYAKSKKIKIASALLSDLIVRLQNSANSRTRYFDEVNLTHLAPPKKTGTRRAWKRALPYSIGIVVAITLVAIGIWNRKEAPAQNLVPQTALLQTAAAAIPVTTPTEPTPATATDQITNNTAPANQVWHPELAITAPGSRIELSSGDNKWSGQGSLKLGSEVNFEEPLVKLVATISQKNFKTQTLKIDLAPDQFKYDKFVQLEKAKTGTLFVGATPWAEVTIPGVVTNKVNPFTITLPEGTHNLYARYQDQNKKWHKLSSRVTIKPDVKSDCKFYFRDPMKVVCE